MKSKSKILIISNVIWKIIFIYGRLRKEVFFVKYTEIDP